MLGERLVEFFRRKTGQIFIRLLISDKAQEFRTPILFTMVWDRSRDLELNGLGPFIGSKQTSDLPMSEQKEDTMVKKKKAKKAKK
jgi:hypothetical protein